ncbi:MAG: hypothetical protein L0215_12495 [Gemmataceae bacterium]|nr:hypothetical protein [Gemmataceae bacterium]
MRWLGWPLLSMLLLVGATGHAGPTQPRPPSREVVEPFGQKTFSLNFEGNQRASVVAIGDGRTFMGLYVYDRHGNCVARDDVGDSPTRDDLAAEWFPPELGPYSIDVVNLGRTFNQFWIAIR